MENYNQPPTVTEELVLNSTPLPTRLTAVQPPEPDKNKSKLYIVAISVVVIFFLISFISYKLTESQTDTTNAAPPMIIKKAPSEEPINPSGTQPDISPPGNEIDELNALDVGSVEAEIQQIQADESLL